MKDEILKARELLSSLTPLKGDCGTYCGGACCLSDNSDESGMLLFPGEEELYASSEWARVVPASFRAQNDALMLVCSGRCPRNERPLACRLFPIAPHVKSDGFKAVLDRRAYAVCPLASYGMSAFDRAFVKACEQAFSVLAGDSECRAHLKAISDLMDEYARGL